jgi:hypothetical protein
MGFLLKLLGGSAGPFIAGGVAVIIAGLLAFGGVQSARLAHAKADLTSARTALKNPATGKTWQSEAVAAERDLGTCRGNLQNLQTSLNDQSASLTALAAAGQARTARADKALSVASGAVQAASKAAGAVMAAKAGDDRCASALTLIRGDRK